MDWDRWPVTEYLDEVYRAIQPEDDDAVLVHHSAFYRQFAPGRFGRSLELGAGSNLYPLMLAAAVSRDIEAVEPSAASVAYLGRQLTEGADESWAPSTAGAVSCSRRCRPPWPVRSPGCGSGERASRICATVIEPQQLPGALRITVTALVPMRQQVVHQRR
ncbi:MAG: hypothetical protein QOE51_4983 [Actinoplanes sp.]|nr:hypothetical protein [Actinoplanes sp.]